MTPAPWSISNGPLEVPPCFVPKSGYLVSHDDGHVALVFTLEDARAVAALPEVVEALEWAMDLLTRTGGFPPSALARYHAAQAALSKLEGKA